MKKNLLVLIFLLTLLISKNFFGLKLVDIVKADEATQSAQLDTATDSAQLDTPTPTPTTKFCKNGSDPENDEGDDDCVDRNDDGGDDDDDDGDDHHDDHHEDTSDGGDDDDDGGSGGSSGSGGPSTLAGAGTTGDILAMIGLGAGTVFVIVGSEYVKKKTRKN